MVQRTQQQKIMANISNVYAYLAVFTFFYFFLRYLLKLANDTISKSHPVQVRSTFYILQSWMIPGDPVE
jgi:hypothetical protein